MFDLVTWEQTIAGQVDGIIDSPVIIGRLLRIKITVTGEGFNEGGVTLYANGKQLTEYNDGFSGGDVLLRVPVQWGLYGNGFDNLEYAAGHPIVEAPVLFGPLSASVRADIPDATWTFEAVVER